MNAKEVTERLHKHGYYDHKDAGDGNGLPVYKWYTYDGILVASDTSKAKAAHEAYKHYLAPIQQITPQAPAPVDILAEKNALIAEQAAEIARKTELLKRIYDLPQIKDIAISILIEDELGMNDPENSPKFAEHFKRQAPAPSQIKH
jgi:hypothetical protein